MPSSIYSDRVLNFAAKDMRYDLNKSLETTDCVFIILLESIQEELAPSKYVFAAVSLAAAGRGFVHRLVERAWA